MRILLTTTSYQDTPGKHHDFLAATGFEVVRARGPLSEDDMLRLITDASTGKPGFDGLLNGDDQITARVIDAALAQPRKLRVIAKYGIGLDSIDVAHATRCKLPVLYTPGVNHTTVAEHTIGLMIALAKHFEPHLRTTREGGWKRITGRELAGKTLAVLGGKGRIGQEVIKRARAFDMNVIGHDLRWTRPLADNAACVEVLRQADILSLHLPLRDDTRHLIDNDALSLMKDGVMVVNTGRGGLVDETAIAEACRSGKLYGYATDVLDHEPMRTPHPFQSIDNIIITPHIGSRTYESVERQAMRATLNIVNYLRGDADFIQANTF